MYFPTSISCTFSMHSLRWPLVTGDIRNLAPYTINAPQLTSSFWTTFQLSSANRQSTAASYWSILLVPTCKVLVLYQVRVQGSRFRVNRLEVWDFRVKLRVWDLSWCLVEISVEISVEIYLRSRGVAPLFILVLAYIRVTMIRNTILPRIRRKFPCFHGNFH